MDELLIAHMEIGKSRRQRQNDNQKQIDAP